MDKYDDIINLPHHVSEFYKPMPIKKRAAQFAPFAALTGHEEAIEETTRLTDKLKEFSEEEKTKISRQIFIAFKTESKIKITYFIPDKNKCGGKYIKVRGVIKKIDDIDRTIELREGIIIPISLIYEVNFICGN